MTVRRTLAIAFAAALAALFCGGAALAYNQYNDGCQSCHGAFTDPTSTKGSTFPGNDKHTMHRASQYMNTACALCHHSTDGNNPFIGYSDGTANNIGRGCIGCHEPLGLRRHHSNSGVSECATCHDNDGTPPPESQSPPYYGTADTHAANSCNPTAQTNVNENWTINCCFGLDNDGDGLYDGADPDCAMATATPGESGVTASLLVAAYDKATQAVTISFGTACSATNNVVEYGPLSSLSTYGYAGQVCNIGNTGAATFTAPTASSFFLVVARNTTKEGSYGERRTGATLAERPEDASSATCPVPQDLTLRCD
jgi:hypothetical protein